VTEATIHIGDVVLLRCTHCNPPKNKFFVVAHLEPLRMFLINSEITEFQRRSQEILATQVVIRAQEHAFLEYDSVIGCDHLSHEYNLERLQEILIKEPQRILGALSRPARAAVKEALKGNELIPFKYLRGMRESWAESDL
jgi:hypothetical protein